MSTAPIPNYALASFRFESSYANDPLLADGHDVTSRKGTVASGGGKMNRGQILHIDAASGAVTAAVTGAAATQANCVLAENIDATSATVQALVYLTGRMKADAVLWPAAGAHAAHTEDLRDVGIYLESVLFRDGIMVKSAATAEEEADAKSRLKDAKERIEAAKTAAAEDQDESDVADSTWSHMTQEERDQHPELAAAAPYDPEKEKEEEDKKEKKEGAKPAPPKPPTPPPPHQQPPPKR